MINKIKWLSCYVLLLLGTFSLSQSYAPGLIPYLLDRIPNAQVLQWSNDQIKGFFGTYFGKTQLSDNIGSDSALYGIVNPENQRLEDWIVKLGEMENCAIEGTMDSGSLSYGRYCFKEGTFRDGVKNLGLYPEAEDKELANVYGDRWAQEQIIRSWYVKDPELMKKHFYTTVVVRKLGLP